MSLSYLCLHDMTCRLTVSVSFDNAGNRILHSCTALHDTVDFGLSVKLESAPEDYRGPKCFCTTITLSIDRHASGIKEENNLF